MSLEKQRFPADVHSEVGQGVNLSKGRIISEIIRLKRYKDVFVLSSVQRSLVVNISNFFLSVLSLIDYQKVKKAKEVKNGELYITEGTNRGINRYFRTYYSRILFFNLY